MLVCLLIWLFKWKRPSRLGWCQTLPILAKIVQPSLTPAWTWPIAWRGRYMNGRVRDGPRKILLDSVDKSLAAYQCAIRVGLACLVCHPLCLLCDGGRRRMIQTRRGKDREVLPQDGTAGWCSAGPLKNKKHRNKVPGNVSHLKGTVTWDFRPAFWPVWMHLGLNVNRFNF